MTAGVGDRAHASGGQLVERPPGGIIGAERAADRIRVGHVEVVCQLPLCRFQEVLVAHHRPRLRQVVQGVQGAPVAALDDLLGFLTAAQRVQCAPCCGGIPQIGPVGLPHCLGKDGGFLRPDLLGDALHLPENVRPAGPQGLHPVALPLGGRGDASGLDDPAHHIPQDALAQLIPGGGHEPGVPVDLFRGQHGVTSCWLPDTLT